MSRDRLECFVKAIETRIVNGLIRKNEKPSCADPLCAYRFPTRKRGGSLGASIAT